MFVSCSDGSDTPSIIARATMLLKFQQFMVVLDGAVLNSGGLEGRLSRVGQSTGDSFKIVYDSDLCMIYDKDWNRVCAVRKVYRDVFVCEFRCA
jgi:hypothetical protein